MLITAYRNEQCKQKRLVQLKTIIKHRIVYKDEPLTRTHIYIKFKLCSPLPSPPKKDVFSYLKLKLCGKPKK